MMLSILVRATLLVLLALLAARVARRSRAAIRHLFLASAFVVLAVLPIGSVIVPSIRISVPVDQTPSNPRPALLSAIVDEAPSAESIADSARVEVSIAQASRWSAFALLQAVWTIGVIVCLIPVAVGLWQMRALRRSALPWPHRRDLVDALSRDANTRRRVDVMLHPSISGPMTCGVSRPIILMPCDATFWSGDELTRALVHELEHVRRGDWLTQCLARVICAVYWFHPLVWIARRQFVLEAERACDDAVIGRTEAAAYADQLILLARRLATSRQPLLAMANRADLATRVRAVLDSRLRRGRAGATAVVYACAACALLVTAMSSIRLVASVGNTITQDKGEPFEVVSIKPCTPGETPAVPGGRSGGGGANTSPGRLNIQCMTVVDIIDRAYVAFGNPPPANHPNTPGGNDIIKGAPEWARSEKYTIEAKATGTPLPATMMGAMLRRLLEDRFQLKIHLETKEVPALALTVAKDGLKIRPIDPASCVMPIPGVTGPRVLRQTAAGPLVFAPDAGPDAKPYCTAGVSPKPPNVAIDVTGMPFDRIVRTLSSLVVNRPVVDQTSVSGQFSFHIEFAPDDNIRPMPRMPGSEGSDLPPGPTIFAAFEKQLGLKLVPTKAAQESLVIDRLEHPSEKSLQQVGATEVAPYVQTAKPKYDVASIKPCEAEPNPTGARGAAGGTNAAISPGRFFVPCVTTEQLIYLAYASYGARPDERLINDDLGSASNASKIRGGPDWVHSLRDKYRIEATAVGATERTVLMGAMLQSLLEDRFKLKIHRDTEEVPLYELTVAKDGLKLKPMKEGDCDPGDGTPPGPETLTAVKPRCGNLMMTMSDAGLTRWTYGGYQLSSLASQLSSVLKVHVIDKTDISDKFVFRFEFLREGTFDATASAAAAALPNGPDVFTALQDQLGLKLVKTKGPRGFIVIDHIERPRPN